MTTNTMWLRTGLLVAALLAAPAGCATSGDWERSNADASIPFVNHGGVRNWEVESSRALLVESANGRWYRATLAGPCPELRFHDSLGFVTDSTHQLDRFSSVIAGGERCWFESFERVPGLTDALPGRR